MSLKPFPTIFLAALISLFAPVPFAAADSGLALLREGRFPKAKIGTNAFVNDPRFGSVRSQLREVRNVLGIRHVRLLFLWHEAIQPSPNSPIDFSFYDEIIASLPPGTDAIAVLTGVPAWMQNPANWKGGDPRRTFVDQWVRPVASRYARKRRLIGLQIWNEPNNDSIAENDLLNLTDGPALYVDMLGAGAAAVRSVAPRLKVISAATTSINQNFPDTLEYNKEMRRAGLERLVDVVGVHFYSVRLETVLFPGGVRDFLRASSRPLWLTESGEQGVNKQRDYAVRVWPFLFGLTPRIKRIYQYNFTDENPANRTWGLRNPTPGQGYSDLYFYLKKLRR